MVTDVPPFFFVSFCFEMTVCLLTVSLSATPEYNTTGFDNPAECQCPASQRRCALSTFFPSKPYFLSRVIRAMPRVFFCMGSSAATALELSERAGLALKNECLWSKLSLNVYSGFCCLALRRALPRTEWCAVQQLPPHPSPLKHH